MPSASSVYAAVRYSLLLGILLLFVTAAGCLLFFAKPVWFPAAITASAVAYDRQFSWTLIVCAVIFITVQILLAAAIFRSRRSGKPKPPSQRSPLRIELLWTASALALFVALSVAGSRGWASVPEGGPGKEVIEVYAHQFAWNFRYPGPDRKFGRSSREFINDASGDPMGLDPADPAGRDDRITSTLRIPAGRDVLLLLHARDVIHDFFVRELRTKQDIVPGMEIPFELHVDRPGTYEIACAELCGLGHSQMHSLLIVLSPEDYRLWTKQEWKRSQ